MPIEIAGKKIPEQLVKSYRENNIKLVIQSPFSHKDMLDQLAGEINGVSISADPLAENWPENLRQVAKALKKALK